MKIPAHGKPKDQIKSELKAFSGRDLPWREGKTLAYIYDGGPDVEEIGKWAYMRYLTENGLDPTLIKAVALVESGFNPKAVSNKGAKGIMQFMPSTAKRYGVTDLHDPYQSLKAGAEHLADLLDAA